MKELFKSVFQNITSKSYSFYIIFGIIVFIVLLLALKNIFLSFFIAFGIPALLLFLEVSRYFLGEKRKYQIIEGNGFKKLIQDGFKIKKFNAYAGITGDYKGYIFDIYYSPSTSVLFKQYGACIFIVYFVLDKNIKTQNKTQLSTKYNFTFSLKRYRLKWELGYVEMQNAVGIFNPSYNRLKKNMDIVVNILSKENIKPLERSVKL